MSIFELSKELIFGTRLRRLSERFLSDVAFIYKERGIPFEPSWFPIFFLLDRYGKMSVSDIANELDITQSGASQMVSLLERKGLVETTHDGTDKRMRYISFTREGIELLRSVKPVWKIIKAKMKEMLEEGENSKYFLEALSEIESSFKRQSLSDRVLDILNKSTFSIATYNETLYGELKRLFFMWLMNYGAESLKLVNEFHTIVRKNKKGIITATEGKELLGALIPVEESSELKVFLCDRDDVDNSVCASLIGEFLKSLRKSNKKIHVYFDGDKIGVSYLLEENGFQKTQNREFVDVDKRLAVFSR